MQSNRMLFAFISLAENDLRSIFHNASKLRPQRIVLNASLERSLSVPAAV